MGRALRPARRLAPGAAIQCRAAERSHARRQAMAVPAAGARRLDGQTIDIRIDRRLPSTATAGGAAERTADGRIESAFPIYFGGISVAVLRTDSYAVRLDPGADRAVGMCRPVGARLGPQAAGLGRDLRRADRQHLVGRSQTAGVRA